MPAHQLPSRPATPARHSLRWRLPVLISAPVVVVLTAFLWAAYRQVEVALLDAGSNRARAAAGQLSALFAQSAQQRVSEVRRVAETDALRQYVELPTPDRERRLRDAVSPLTWPTGQLIELWSRDGRRLLTIASPQWADDTLPGGSMPTGSGVGPIQVHGTLLFSELVAEIPRSLGYLVLRRPVLLTPTPEVLSQLVGGNAIVRIGNKVGDPWTDFRGISPRPPVDISRPGGGSYRGSEGEGHIGALADVRGTPWTVWVDFPGAVVLAPARIFAARTIPIAAFLVVLAAVLARTLAARITTPLSKLTRAAEAIAAGDYDSPVGARGDDEIGRLGQAFDSMTNEVQQAHQRLEARIGEGVRTLEALAKSEARYRAIVNVAFDCIITIDAQGIVSEFNPAAEKTFGYRREDAIGRELAELIVPPSSREAHRRGLARYLATGEAPVLGKVIEIAAMRSDGAEFLVDLAITEIKSDGPPMFTGIVRDITRRRQVEEARARLAAIVETSDDAIISKTLDGAILSWNAGATKLYGYAAEDMIGQPISRLIPSDRGDELRAILGKIRKGESVEHYETRRVRKDGTLVDVAVTVSPLKDIRGEVIGASTIARDITARKRVERALCESEERTQFALTAGRMSVWEFELSSDRVIWSDSPSAVFGLSWEEAPRTRPAFLDLIHADDRGPFYAAMQEAIAERRPGFNMNFRTIWSDGSVHWVESRARIVFGEQGKPVRVVGLGADVSERQLLEAQLRQAQKMEAVGQLAGGVAHDFNNLLTAILGYANFLRGSLDQDDQRRSDIDEIIRAGTRAADLTRQLLAFSRQQVLRLTAVDLTRLVTEMGQMLRRLIGEHIEFVAVLAPDLALVKADRGQLEQVLMNLVVNARDAMPSGGRLMVETSNVEIDESYAIHDAPVRPGSYVMLAVSDSGVGMTEDTRRRIFEPFFTTKERGQGTGLGLATVYGIVKQSGGYIWTYSEPGCGATFKVYLPRAERGDKVLEPIATGAAPLARGSETVLVVEDEEAVRFLTCTILERAGYHVFGAADPQQAEAVFDQNAESVDLLVSDVVMPGSSGPTLFGRLARHRPDLKVLYVSGYTDEMIVHQGRLAPGIEFLQKPFSADGLTQKVREVLDQ